MPERLVPLEGTLNFRDIGGYPANGGGRVRWGQVFRSDALSKLTTGDWNRLAAMGITTIIDFRRRIEVDAAPTVVPTGLGIETFALGIGEGQRETNEMLQQVVEGTVKAVGIDDMVRIYLLLTDKYAPVFGAGLTVLTERHRLPAVMHCTAGKDRTGLITALLLSVLGVDETTILDDYELSTQFRSEQRILELMPRLRTAGVDVEDVRPYFSAPRPALSTALGWMRDEFGSVEGYLLGPAGMRRDHLDKLRQLLIEPSPR